MTYAGLAFALSWCAWLPLLLHRVSFASRLWKMSYVAGLSGPLVASLILSFALGGKEQVQTLAKRGVMWRVGARWHAVALLLPPSLMLAGWYIAKALGETHRVWEMPSLGLVPLTFVVMALRGGPLNEEFGWRGFLLPYLLERFSPFSASLIVAPIWTLWHAPLWFLPGVPHKHWPFGLFALLLVPTTFLFTWLHQRGKGSILLPILLHTSFNTAIHYLPILPPRHASLVPFEMWVGVTWLFTLVVVLKNARTWLARPALVAQRRVLPTKTAAGEDLPGLGAPASD